MRLTTRLIEGEFPNYRQLIPSSYPNRLTVGREPLLDAVRRVKLLAREATPVRMALRADGLELTAITQDVGQAHEDLDAKYEGAEMVVAFNPEYLIDGVEAIAGDEVVARDPRRPQAGRAPVDRGHRLPVPAHAGPGLLTRRATSEVRVDALWLTDFRNYAHGRARPGPRPDRRAGRQRRGQDQPARGHRLPGHPARRSGARRRGARPGRGATQAVVRAEVATRRAGTLLDRGRAAPTGRDRVMVNRQPLRRARDLLGALRVSVFSPDDLGWSRAARPSAAGSSTTRWWPCAPATTPSARDLDRVLRQRNALLKQSGGRLTPEIATTLDVWDAKLVGRRRGAWPDARAAWSPSLEPAVAEAYAPGRPTGRRGRAVRTTPRGGGDGPGRRRWRRPATTTCAGACAWSAPTATTWRSRIGGLPARTHASQGEQRSLALALRLAAHRLVTEVARDAAVLLLDDVFSELDPAAAAASLAPPARRPGPAHHRRPPPRGADPELVVTGRRPAETAGEATVASAARARRPAGPARSPSRSTAWRAHLGAPAARPSSTVLAGWAEVVGEHAGRPLPGRVALRDGTLAVARRRARPGRPSCGGSEAELSPSRLGRRRRRRRRCTRMRGPRSAPR